MIVFAEQLLASKLLLASTPMPPAEPQTWKGPANKGAGSLSTLQTVLVSFDFEIGNSNLHPPFEVLPSTRVCDMQQARARHGKIQEVLGGQIPWNPLTTSLQRNLSRSVAVPTKLNLWALKQRMESVPLCSQKEANY